MGAHINGNGQFQSDKYPSCPPGKVPLSVKDASAQDLLWEYAQRRRAIDAEFSDDLEACLKSEGFVPPVAQGADMDTPFHLQVDGVIRELGHERSLAAEIIELRRESAWKGRLLQWCRVRLLQLRRKGYADTLDRYIAEGPKAPNMTPLVQSEVEGGPDHAGA